MKWMLITMLHCICSTVFAQNMDAKLGAEIKVLEADAQFKHAILSMYVADCKTGKVVFEKNAQIGLAPASCQKVVTSVSAFEMLGKNFRYKTSFLNCKDLHLNENDLYIIGSGDPTFGSSRFSSTKDSVIFKVLFKNLRLNKINEIRTVFVNDIDFGNSAIPDGWIWEDIGNYYGAGHHQINWRENQYNLEFASVQPNVHTKLKKTEPKIPGVVFNNQVISGKLGSGDDAYVYFVPGTNSILMQGTIPPNKNSFTIAGAVSDPVHIFINEFESFFVDINHFISIKNPGQIRRKFNEPSNLLAGIPGYQVDTISFYFSPPLDSINYWFLKKSINLYGEAFVKTIAYEKTKFGSTDTGIAIIKNFWSKRGIEPSALNIIDGSGLSPANRVTTNALVTVLQYAQQQPWFTSFYNALPEINGIKMKDGYINGVRSYTGYIKSKSGAAYTFSFIVNNFDGSPGTVREKMWKLLDILK